MAFSCVLENQWVRREAVPIKEFIISVFCPVEQTWQRVVGDIQGSIDREIDLQTSTLRNMSDSPPQVRPVLGRGARVSENGHRPTEPSKYRKGSRARYLALCPEVALPYDEVFFNRQSVREPLQIEGLLIDLYTLS
ncbi:MAG: hypothetical protein N838_32340 [Thiohalocapsa sp. PB-PSB1]|jgi:hypothetical protein|nr:MAG: hypothetical protein N838_32340 [Thiohalocapsa sp. PB-PSB1]